MNPHQPQRLLFTNAYLFGSIDEWPIGWLLTEGKHIRLMGSGRAPEFTEDGEVTRSIDCTGLMVLPGFIDLHVHGAIGHEAMDASPDALQAMARFYAQHGVTGFLPTTWTHSHERTQRALDVITELTGRVSNGATILGAQMEGPYLNAAKSGAQAPQFIRRADRSEVAKYLDNNHIKLLALAPEFEENLWLIDECVRRGITVSAAHTAATYQQMVVAVEHGLTHATHTFNAMAGLGHRDPGTVGAVMALPQIRAELIADNIHVHPVALKILVQIKGIDKVILITDAIRGCGMPDGDYPIDERTIHIHDGSARLPDGTLAGSVLTMDLALRNILQATNLSLREAWQMTSLNAAQAIGISANKGSLEIGKDTDLTVLDHDLNVVMTIAEGEIVYESPR
jgi:N-acetylglucosamine-6-phosphate deacetylase